jgi:1-acyl-sn-glycerol-3-phosphate acyltransferase
MLYYLAKFIMWFTVRVYFRKVSVTGAQHIPEGKPVILIVNHSASFLDAILLGSLLKRQLYFYARSDVFKAGLAFRLMKMVHMIPIYNMEHSKEDLHRNVETFDEGEKALARKKMLVIFPEGISRQERILLPLKKGTARVAVHAASKQGFDMGLEIIPVGINYTFHRFRSDVVLTVGETTRLIDYAETYAQNPNKAINAITRDIEKKFAATVIFVAQANRTDLINHLLFYFQNDFEWENKHSQAGSLIKREKEICEVVTAMEDQQAISTWQQISRYTNLLKTSRLKGSEIKLLRGLISIPALHLLQVAWLFFFTG